MTISALDREFLIRTVIGEAARESDVGKAAVAHVILNRVRAGSFGGRTVHEVVLAPSQFEPWQTRRDALLSIPKYSEVYRNAEAVVDQVLAGQVPDPTEGATHFLNVDIVRQRSGTVPDWAARMAQTGSVQKIGNHTFLGGGQRVAQAERGTASDVTPVNAAERAQAILGGTGPRNAPPPDQATPPPAEPGPSQVNLDRARAILGTERKPKPQGEQRDRSLGARAVRGLYAAADTVADTVLLGGGDEAQAGLGALLGEGQGDTISARYSNLLEQNRARRADFRGNNSKLQAGLDIGTAVGTGLMLGPVVAARTGITPATTTGGRLTQAAGAGAVVGGVTGFNTGEGGAGNRALSAGQGVLIGGALGVGGDIALGLVERVLRPHIARGRAFINGELTDEAKLALAQAGIDPAQIGEGLARAFADRSRRLTVGPESARRAAADEFNIPLSAGQAKADFDDIAFEEAARSGARGGAAGAVARTFEDQQRGAIREAGENLIPSGSTAAEAGETVRGGLLAARKTARAEVRAAYDAIPQGTVIDVRAFDRLRQDATEALDAVTLNPSAHARAALAEIDRLTQRTRTVRPKPTGETGLSVPGDTTGDSARLVGVDFAAVEGLRKRLNAISRRIGTSDPQAAYEVNQIRQAIDDWIDRSVAESLIAGDDAALTVVRAAREKYAAYRRMFTQQGGGDDAGKMLEIMTDPRLRPDGLTPQETVRYLFGAAKVGAAPHSVRMARRVKGILGPDSEEWQALRQGAWQRVIAPAEGKEIGAQQLASRVMDFTRGEGAALARELFTPEEIAKMNRFANVLRMTVPPRRATNPSGTAAALTRTVQDAFNQVTTMVGVASGNVGQAFGARLLTGILKSQGGRRRALATFDPGGRLPVSDRTRQAGAFAGGLLGGGVSLEGALDATLGTARPQ